MTDLKPQSLHVNGYDMTFVEQGAGETVVLVHGSLQDYRYWAPQMAAFSAGHRVIALSLRHYWPARWDGKGGGFTIAQHVADVAGFISALGVGPVRLVGHSRGGHIAFRVAEHHAKALRAVVLAEPGGELDASLGGAAPGVGSGRQAEVFAAAAERVGAGEIEEGLRGFAAHTGGPGAWEKRPEARRQIARDNAQTLLGQVNESRGPFAKASAEALRTPTLLVGGAQTQPQFIATLDALERTIPGAQRATIAGAGHPMSAENPVAFNTAVLAFFAVH